MQNRPIRILFNVCADAENYNAQSLNAREIALRLDPARFCSTLFIERFPDSRLSRSGIRLVRLPARRRTLRILREMLGRYDAIMYMDPSPASYAYLHIPRIVRGSTLAISYVEGTRGNFDKVSAAVRKYGAYIVRHSDVRAAISKFVADDTEDFRGVRPDHIVSVGVDTRVFHPPLQPGGADVPTVLFVGHLIERKGPQYVLQAARQIPEASFRLVGSARDAFGESLTERCKDLPNVRIESPMPQVQLAEFLRAADVLLHPSRVEGVPKVTLEAAATGLPSIVFDDYQTPSVVHGTTGFQVKTFEEMLARLKILIADRTLRQRMGAAAVIHARSFDWDRIAEQWSAILEQEVPRKR